MADDNAESAASHVRNRRQRWVSTSLVVAVLVGGAGGSWVVHEAVQRIQDQHARRLMDQYADNTVRAVTGEAARYSDSLADLGAAIGAQSTFTADDFATITSRFNNRRLPGASGVGFVVSAAPTETAAVQNRWRERGATGVRLVPVGTRAEHMFVVFSRPLDNVVPVFGRDLSQVAEPLEGLQLSRASGEVAASRSYVLLKDRNLPDAERQLSFSLTMPIYGGIGTPDRGQFRGWVLMSMRGGDFINETLQNEARDAVKVTLADLSSGEPITVASTTKVENPSPGPLQRTRIVTVGQRKWQLQIEPTDRLLNATDRSLPALASSIGLLLTLLLGALATGRRRALTKVDQATAALRVDIEQRKAIEAQLRHSEKDLRHLALHDPLTGLANRTLFYERLQHAMATHNRSDSTLAVFFIDLDGFKKINDARGHSAGDAILAGVADRLRECARDSDTVARFGGDEFAIVTEQLAAPEHVEIIADRIVRALQSPFDIDGQPVVISGSVGIALHQQGDRVADKMVRSADEAMYAAKTSGKNRYAFAAAVPA